MMNGTISLHFSCVDKPQQQKETKKKLEENHP